jgi:hypothetical protein
MLLAEHENRAHACPEHGVIDETRREDGPEQGVIEEARRRHQARRVRGALAACILLAAGLAGMLLASSGGGARAEGPLHLAPEPAPVPFAALLDAAHRDVVVRLVPNLEGAQAGWCEQIIQRHMAGGGCDQLPTKTTALFAASTGWGYGEHDETTVVITAPEVSNVLFSNRRRSQTSADPELPYGLRLAVLKTPHRSDRPRPITAVAAFEHAGRRLTNRSAPGSRLPWRIWNPPAAPAHGACQLRLTAGYRAKTEWGQVAAMIGPYPAPLLGRGFLACIDSEYYVPGRGMRASVLLDAARPDRAEPTAIPGLSPVAGLPGIYNTARGYQFEPMTARREGRAWIVVAGGGRNSEEARIRLLNHLAVTIDSRPR